jgi:hypothetical protein
VNSLFCRHNRFTADCPICSKGTVLDPNRQASRPRSSSSGSSRSRSGGAAGKPTMARVVSGPYASAGPYEDELGDSYEVRLERVPGGVRLAEWALGKIRRSAPVLAAADLAPLLETTRERSVLGEADAEALVAAASAEPGAADGGFGASRGRAGDMQEELRVEPLGEGRLRIARWILRPGAGWELQEAPVMLPAGRYAEAIRAAAGHGLLAG